MECPNSHPGDFSGHILSFPLSSLDPVGLDTVATGQPPDPSYVPAENSPDQAPVTPASYTGLNGFQESSPACDQGVEHFNTKKSLAVGSPQMQDMTTWPAQSPQLTLPQDTDPHYSSMRPGPGFFDGVPYPSPEDTSSSISLSTFNFTPPSISQPTSFLRHSTDTDHAGPERDAWPERLPKRVRLHPPLSTDPFSIYGRDCSRFADSRGECTGSLPFDPSVSLSSPQGTMPRSPGSISSPGDLFKVLDGHEVPNNSPGASCTSPDSIPRTSERSDCELSKQKWKAYLNSVEDNYGLDCGLLDLDLNKNDDHAAIDVNSALVLTGNRRASHVSRVMDSKLPEQPNWDGTKHGYYESPVPINIPRYLSPLPSSLLENPINLMYFHHYLNHTSRMLVPHDCEDNPFVSVMPSSKPPCMVCCSVLTKQWPFRIRIS